MPVDEWSSELPTYRTAHLAHADQAQATHDDIMTAAEEGEEPDDEGNGELAEEEEEGHPDGSDLHADDQQDLDQQNASNPHQVSSRDRQPRAKAPPKELPLGTSVFPISRINRLLKADENIEQISRDGTFLISIAAELFVKAITEQAYATSRLERRRHISYNDVHGVISSNPYWSYLRDVFPDQTSYGDALNQREQLVAKRSAAAADFFGVPPPVLESNTPHEAPLALPLQDDHGIEEIQGGPDVDMHEG